MQASLTQEDYEMTMKTLSGNLAEGTPPRRKPPSQPPTEEVAAPVAASVGGGREQVVVESHRQGDASVAPSALSVEATARRISLGVQLAGVNADLYSGSSGLVSLPQPSLVAPFSYTCRLVWSFRGRALASSNVTGRTISPASQLRTSHSLWASNRTRR